MKMNIFKGSVLGAVAAIAVGTTAKADNTITLVPVSTHYVFAPVGFDDNDETLVVLDGYLPNSCYRVADPEIVSDLVGKKISVQARARYIGGVACLQALVPYTKTVKLGVLPKGDYTVLSNQGMLGEPMAVTQANNAGPDDFLYAPVDSARVQTALDGTLSAVLEGRFTNTCMQWKEAKVFYTGKTIQLLPVIQMGEENCQEVETPYRQVVALNRLDAGRYLLHVRSLNGESVNTVFPAFDHGDPIGNPTH